ncbi:MAG: Hsp20/alpha crystallin family protein [Candidatus Nanopelagicales bacterium]
MAEHRSRPPGGGIPGGPRGKAPRSGDFSAAGERLREVAKRLEPLGDRLEQAHAEIVDRLAAAGVVDKVREVPIEVFDEGDEVVAVAEVPGVVQSDISIAVEGRELSIEGFRSDQRLSGTVLLPAEVTPEWAVTTRNGLMEIRFRKMEGS